MIVRMSKVEIVGPKSLREDVILRLQESGIFQIEPACVGFVEKGCEEHVRSLLLDEKTLSERLFLEDLRQKIDALFSLLPRVPVRDSYLDPVPVLDTVTKVIGGHLQRCKELAERREALQKEMAELRRYTLFLGTLSSLAKGTGETPDLDFIGLTIKDPAAVDQVRELLSRMTDRRFELLTEPSEDGTLVGLITIEKGISERVKRSLSEERIPEFTFPAAVAHLTLPEKITHIERRASGVEADVAGIEGEMAGFAHRWLPIYRRIREWADERLSLLRATASVFETRMCFFINGWMPSDAVEPLRKRLHETFAGRVALEEKEIFEEDLERIPVALRNPPILRPFELLVELLPLPKYTSFDPTPFIGIFFPLFFGMILGDAGYGTVLVLLSVFLRKRFRGRKHIRDAGAVLLVSSVYSILFGILYGEFFGELGRTLFGLTPLFLERREAVLPLLYFSLAVGVAHVLLGLFLGFLSALKKKTKREAVSRLFHMATIVSLMILTISFFRPAPWPAAKPVLVVLLFLIPVMFLTGGLLAPFELLKSIGNIISYARIMAIGLASVLLALVANRLAGMTGDILLGVVVAGLLHIVNLILGILSPTIHSLRLHYVEFFSKFLEHGGKRFEPLRK